jgi:hypothetical protein
VILATLLLALSVTRIEVSSYGPGDQYVTITDPERITLIMRSFIWKPQDGRNLGIIPDAHITFHYKNGKVRRGLIIGGCQFIMTGRRGRYLYPLHPKTKSFLICDSLGRPNGIKD